MNTRVEVHCVDYILSRIEAANHYSESLESEELDDELSELESLPDELELLALSLLVAPTAPPSRGFSFLTVFLPGVPEAEAPVTAAAAALASITFLSDTSTFAAPLTDGIIGGISLTLVGVFFGVAAG